MKGDFSRNSFDPSKAFTRVLMQQGRVQLDADWNEQVSIFWQFLRTLTRDLIGPYGGPEHDCGFTVLAPGDDPKYMTEDQQRRVRAIKEGADFLIGPGHYYVDGILCNNRDYVLFSKQGHHHGSGLVRNTGSRHLIYLDVWEREISAAEDESIKEVGLNGIDTAERARIAWQVSSFELKDDPDTPFIGAADLGTVQENWHQFIEHWQPLHRGRLRARASSVIDSGFTDPSIAAPAAQYRGPQNQLYRVEIHEGGSTSGEKEGPTFKWSRENGSVVFPIASAPGDQVVILKNLGRDLRSGLQVGDWVEIVDDDYILQRRAEPLRQVGQIEGDQVTLKGLPVSTVGTYADKHPVLRRWDQKQGDPRRGGLELRNGAALIKDSDKFWLNLENGVQVQFKPTKPISKYRTGDYWLIPARTATANVEWPQRTGEADDLPPEGIEHHYAPLAIVVFANNLLENLADCRPKLKISREY